MDKFPTEEDYMSIAAVAAAAERCGYWLHAARLRKQTEMIVTLRKTVTISLGAVTWYPQSGKPVVFAGLLRVADRELYEAKRAGRNCVRASCI